jgi:hypothetical protein
VVVSESSGVTVLLAVIALSSLVQGAILLGLAWGGRRLTHRVNELQGRVDRDIRPALDSLSRISHNLAETSDLAVLQVRRLEGFLGDAFDRVEETRRQIQRAARVPLSALDRVIAVFRGVRRGLDVYHQLGGLQTQSRGRARSYREDEHLFI